MNQLQQLEFDMLKEFVRVCDALHLTYYLVCGSALGAAKYEGFIPWDDDLDVALPRPDYEIFCEKAQALLPDHLFLQNSRTDPQYPLIFSKLRDSRTTYVEKPYKSTDMHHGVYIDVFPLDGCPTEKADRVRLEKEKQRYGLALLSCIHAELSAKVKLVVALERLLGIHKKPARFVGRLEAYISQFPSADAEKWCNHGNWQGVLEYAPREQYGEGAWATFEGLPVRIPEKIDEYLTQKYGEWRADLPKEEQVGHHYYEIMDLEKPYTAYKTVQPNGSVSFG